MLGYFIFAICIVVSYFHPKISSKYMLFFLLLFSAIRYDTGWDYMGYYESVDAVSHGYLIHNYGTVWEYIFGIAKWIPFYWFPISLVAIITNLLIYSALKLILDKQDDVLKTALVFYAFFPSFYLASFSTVRQWLAIAFCFFAICLFLRYNNKRNFIIFLLLIVFSSIYIHPSAIITIFLLPLYYINKYVKNIWLLIIGGGLLILSLLLFMTNMAINFLFDEYQKYIDKVDTFGQKIQYINLLILIIISYGYKYLKKTQWISFFALITLFSIVASVLILNIFKVSIMDRILMYFTIMWLFPISYLICLWRKKHPEIRVLFTCTLVLIFFIYLYHIQYVSALSPYTPYKTIFVLW